MSWEYKDTPEHFTRWQQENGLAATPPAQEVEPVASLYVSNFRGLENRSFDYYGDLPDGTYKLYTHPQSDGLRKAAEGLLKYLDSGQTAYSGNFYIENLRAALEGK